MLTLMTACTSSQETVDNHELDLDKVEDSTAAPADEPVAVESVDADSVAVAPKAHRKLKRAHKKKHAKHVVKKHKKVKKTDLSLQPE